MTQKDWILLLVPVLISGLITLIGYVITMHGVKIEYRNSLNEKIFLQKKNYILNL